MNWFEKLHETFIVDDRYMWMVEGLGNTLIITFGALAIGVVIGTLVAVAKYFSEGNIERNPLTEFNSSNTKLLTVEETKAKIASLAYIQEELKK